MENDPLNPAETAWDDATPKDTWRNFSATGRLAMLLTGATFCALFFPFMEKPWGLQLAILAAYTVLVFFLVFRDRNCSLRKPLVREQLPGFLLLHLPFLAIVYGIVVEWLNLESRMPDWLTVQGRKGSFYEWILIALLCLIAWRQQHWMRSIVKQKLTGDMERRP